MTALAQTNGSIPALPDRRRTRHPAKVMLRARELVAAGWSLSEIQQLLVQEFGLEGPPTRTTISLWTDERYRARYYRDMQVRRARKRAGTAAPPPPEGLLRGPRLLTDEVLLELREGDRVSYQTLSVIARRFYGVSLTEDAIRHRLTRLGATTNPKKTRPRRAA